MSIVKKLGHFLVTTPTVISIILGLTLAVWHNIGSGIPSSVQIVFSLLFIGLTGIPHGAIDHLVEQETAKRMDKSFEMPVFILKYLLIMLGYGIVWLWQPSISLLLFIIISAWHFGETDIENAPSDAPWNFTRLFFGSFVIGYLLLTHSGEVTPILGRISQYNPTLMNTWHNLVEFQNAAFLFSFLIFSIVFSIAQSNKSIFIDKIRILRLFIILITAYFLPLMVAFALYFGGWHALCSFNTIKNYIFNSEVNKLKSTPALALSVWSKTLLFSVIAVVFLGFATWYWFNYRQESDPLPPLFIFLSLITLPHLTVMHGMNKYVEIVKLN